MSNWAEPSQERRGQMRSKTLFTGTIRFQNRMMAMTCQVRNVSESGARFVLGEPAWLPDAVELEIPRRDLRTKARIVWRRDQEIGIAFVHQPGEATHESLSQARRIRALERERDQLRRRIRQLTDEE